MFGYETIEHCESELEIGDLVEFERFDKDGNALGIYFGPTNSFIKYNHDYDDKKHATLYFFKENRLAHKCHITRVKKIEKKK